MSVANPNCISSRKRDSSESSSSGLSSTSFENQDVGTRRNSADSCESANRTVPVKVVVRVRPFLEGEEEVRCVRKEKDDSRCIALSDRRSTHARFRYDDCFGEDSTTAEIFDKWCSPLVPPVFEGFNSTIFAYGMTGSGKTHTLLSSEGIVPLLVREILEGTSSFRQRKEDITIKMSFLELYNEKVYDLLVLKESDLQIREDQDRNIFVANLAEIPIESMEDFQTLYTRGCRNRRTAATKLNSSSSRSHAVIMFKILRRALDRSGTLIMGKLLACDLCGSEDNRRTGNVGARLTESSNINSSLFALGKVVNALNSGMSRIPYRDSKITRLLQDALGGRSRSLMIANVTPGLENFLETQSTLHFAQKARQIVNTPVVHAENITNEIFSPSLKEKSSSNSFQERLEEWRKKKESKLRGQESTNQEDQEDRSMIQKIRELDKIWRDQKKDMDSRQYARKELEDLIETNQTIQELIRKKYGNRQQSKRKDSVVNSWGSAQRIQGSGAILKPAVSSSQTSVVLSSSNRNRVKESKVVPTARTTSSTSRKDFAWFFEDDGSENEDQSDSDPEWLANEFDDESDFDSGASEIDDLVPTPARVRKAKKCAKRVQKSCLGKREIHELDASEANKTHVPGPDDKKRSKVGPLSSSTEIRVAETSRTLAFVRKIAVSSKAESRLHNRGEGKCESSLASLSRKSIGIESRRTVLSDISNSRENSMDAKKPDEPASKRSSSSSGSKEDMWKKCSVPGGIRLDGPSSSEMLSETLSRPGVERSFIFQKWNEIMEALRQGDRKLLLKIKGIGPKTAEKILSLRENGQHLSQLEDLELAGMKPGCIRNMWTLYIS